MWKKSSINLEVETGRSTSPQLDDQGGESCEDRIEGGHGNMTDKANRGHNGGELARNC